jgi:hypothetical protein
VLLLFFLLGAGLEKEKRHHDQDKRPELQKHVWLLRRAGGLRRKPYPGEHQCHNAAHESNQQNPSCHFPFTREHFNTIFATCHNQATILPSRSQ